MPPKAPPLETSSTSIFAASIPENGGDLSLVVVHTLALRVHLQAAVVGHREAGLGFEEGVFDALGGECGVDCVRRLLEGCLHISPGEGTDLEEIAALMDAGRVGSEGRLGRRHRIEDLVVDVHGGRRLCVPEIRCRRRRTATTSPTYRVGSPSATSNGQSRTIRPWLQMPGISAAVMTRSTPGMESGVRRVDRKHSGPGVFREDRRAVEHAVDLHIGDEVFSAQGLVATSIPFARCADSVDFQRFLRTCHAVLFAKKVVGAVVVLG